MALQNAYKIIENDLWSASLVGVSSAPGTCGELMQGYIDGKDFLINSPIPFYARVYISLKTSGEVKVISRGHYAKVANVVRETLKLYNSADLGAEISIESKIPRGKGLASSTSELTAAIVATAQALNQDISQEQIVRILIHVDHSSDGVFLPGINMFNHLSGLRYESFGDPPPLNFIIVDTGGEVSTMGFNREQARSVAKTHEVELRRGITLLRKGFERKNAALIAAGATISAIVNQKVLHKPLLETLIEGTLEFGGLGVNCAHTGTVLGVMYDPNKTSTLALMHRVRSLIGEKPILGVYPLIPGGTYQQEP